MSAMILLYPESIKYIVTVFVSLPSSLFRVITLNKKMKFFETLDYTFLGFLVHYDKKNIFSSQLDKIIGDLNLTFRIFRKQLAIK